MLRISFHISNYMYSYCAVWEIESIREEYNYTIYIMPNARRYFTARQETTRNMQIYQRNGQPASLELLPPGEDHNLAKAIWWTETRTYTEITQKYKYLRIFHIPETQKEN